MPKTKTKPYTGLYLRYDFDSTLLIKGHYLKGKPEGVWREYYANTNFKSALMEECEYKKWCKDKIHEVPT
jgi:antitoxin component YwqK of YwqJK toxin-antitoxin module